MPSGVLKKPILLVNRVLGHASAINRNPKRAIDNTSALEDDQIEQEIEKTQRKQAKQQQREDDKKERRQRREDEDAARAGDQDSIRERYGWDSALERPSQSLHDALASGMRPGDGISFIARIHHIRSLSPKMIFVVFRQLDTIQGILEYQEDQVSEKFISWAKHLVSETIVQVKGTVREPQEPISGCSIHNMEILIESMHVIVPVKEPLLIDVYGIDRVEEDKGAHEPGFVAPTRVRIGNRISYLRTPTAQAIFRIQAAVCSIFRSTLEQQGFIEIHTPKLQSSATESGAQVFKANYFGRKAFLAQSPQLAKQLCISADFGRVYEVGSVFRAEDSNTHRHLTEYTSMDLEMTISQHYHEALSVIDDLLKSIFKGIHERHQRDIEIIKTHFPHTNLVWLEETPRISFKDAVGLLNSSGWTDDDGKQASEYEDFGTRAEIQLGKLIKEKYKTDYYIIDKFPTSARPFYTQLDPDDDKITNSFDIFVRGQEIVTGGQRISDPDILASRMKKAGIDPADMKEYMEGFECGVLPHAGCGIGLERLLFLFLSLQDIRNASLFPRDPRSLPEKRGGDLPPLPHPEAETIRYSYEYKRHLDDGEPAPEPPTVEKLIANYGDATNTAWLDERYHVWRHAPTGAAVGYAVSKGYAIVMGNPLCDHRQYQPVMRAFLEDLRQKEDLRPVWLLVSREVEEILACRLRWRSLSCVAEERVDPDNAKAVGKKQRRAEEAGVRIHSVALGQPVPEDLREKCDRRIEEWKAGRKGRQVHITDVRPWVDMEHRRYLWAETSDGEVAALVVLHRLSPEHGYQIKFALDFPGAPGGSIETLISRAIQSLAEAGVQSVTFGAGATPEIEAGSNMHGLRVRMLKKTYRLIVKQLELIHKSEFREKFGTEQDPVYICYPPFGLAVSGARTLIRFFEDEM